MTITITGMVGTNTIAESKQEEHKMGMLEQELTIKIEKLKTETERERLHVDKEKLHMD